MAGTDRSTAVRECLKDIRLTKKRPDDICYANNFKAPDRPRILYLPPGYGRVFQKEMDRLIRRLTERRPRIFESEGF